MPQFLTPDMLPPEYREQLEEQQRRYEKFQAEEIRLSQEIIRDLYIFAGFTCDCRPWFTWSNLQAPQYSCSLHGNFTNTMIWLDYRRDHARDRDTG